MNNLVRCIEDIRKRLDVLRRHGLNEASTRRIIIDCLLEALGWDLLDPDEVQLEYQTVDGKPADYALKLNRRPILLVEAKPLDNSLDDVKDEAQIVRYAATEGIVWCILTNGVRWKVYRSTEECPAPEKLMFEVSLDEQKASGLSVGELAARLWRFSREQMARGTLDALGEQTFTDGKIRKALDGLMRDPPRTFIKLIRQAVGDDRLKPERIRESLLRLVGAATPIAVHSRQPSSRDEKTRRVSQPFPPPAGSDRRRGRSSRKSRSTYDELYHTSGKPKEVIELYRAIERVCLALEPGGIEKRFLAKIISFDAQGRGFCSVHLQRAGLRVWLYLKLHQLENPPPFARDVSKVGHWGGGDLELGISDIAQVQEAETLIQASYKSRCCGDR